MLGASPPFRRALVLSLALHAAAGGYILARADAAPPRPVEVLQVSLAPAPAQVVEAPRPAAADPEPRQRAPRSRPSQAPVKAAAVEPRDLPAESAAGAVPLPLATPAPSPDPGLKVAAAPAAAGDADDAYRPPVYEVAYLSNPAPEYPPQARRRGLEGRVVLRAEVAADGACRNVSVREGSGHDLLDRTALDAVRKWRFVPAKRGERPVEAWVDIPITFKLQG